MFRLILFLFKLILLPFRLLIPLLIPFIFIGIFVLILYTSLWLPDPSQLLEKNPDTTAFINYSQTYQAEKKSGVKIRQSWIPLREISRPLVEAVLIAEDDRFFQHRGFDFTEILNAAETNVRNGKVIRGGSTISQQLAKNLYLVPDRTWWRKFNEVLLTWKIEQSLPKERILELYLNVVDWGKGCFGCEAAAQMYFSKSASRLNEKEAARLAALLPNPDYLHSSSGEKKRIARENMIYSRLVKRTADAPDPRQPSNPILDKQPERNSWGEQIPQIASGLLKQSSQMAGLASGIRERLVSAKDQVHKGFESLLAVNENDWQELKTAESKEAPLQDIAVETKPIHKEEQIGLSGSRSPIEVTRTIQVPGIRKKTPQERQRLLEELNRLEQALAQ